MTSFQRLRRIVSPPRFQDDEKTRVASVLNASGIAVLIGLCTLVLYRQMSDQIRQVSPIIGMGGLAIAALLLIRRGLVEWSAALLSWALLVFLIYMISFNDGIHDSAVLALPGALVLGSLVLKRKHFIAFTTTALLLIPAIAYLEISGILQNQYSNKTAYSDSLDMVVILGITALTIRLLSTDLSKSLALARGNEKALQTKAAQLVESEQRYRALFDGANDAILIMNSERFLQCNAMTLEMFGCKDVADILGSSPWEFSPAAQPDGRQSRDKAIELIRGALNGRAQSFYWKHSRKDGSLFDAEVSLSSVDLGTGVVIQALVRDISTRIQAENALRESEQRFSILSGASFEGISISDNGRIIDVNEQLAAMLRYERSEMIGSAVERFIAPESLERVLHHTRAGSGEVSEHLYVRKDGSNFPVEIRAKSIPYKGRVVRVTAVRDITEREHAEARIEEQARLLDITRDAIIVRDMNDKLLYLNRSAQQLYGWTFEEAQTILPEEVMAAGDVEKYRREREAFVTKGEWDGELRQRRKDGKELVIQTHWTLVRDKHGVPSARLIINRDITEKRRLEAQFRRVQRLESLGTLAGGIAHDLNNVLAPITMSLALLDQKITDPSLKRFISSLESSAQRGADIVKQVLLFARGSEKEFAPQQLRYIVREITAIIRETFPRNINLTTDIAQNLSFVQGDATQLHQVLMNLCVNARDAMPDGGQLAITASNIRLDENDAKMLMAGRPGDYVILSISDTGTGIPKEIQERIFEPFFTTKDLGKGTGLGLSTVYAIVKDHHGFINLYSEVGKGACFKVCLPTVRHDEPIRRTEQKSAALSGKGEVIMVVDDEEAVLEIARTILELHGYKVLSASTGAEAVSVFGLAERGYIQLVLTDVNMPGIDGLEAVEEIRKMDNHVKVIVGSGVVAEVNPVHTRKLRIQGYLMKPYTSERMLTMIQEVLHGSQVPH